jgi:putative membrane protein
MFMRAIFGLLIRSALVLMAVSFAHTAYAVDALPGARFVGFTQEANDFAIASSRIALTRSGNDMVRAYANRIVVEHEEIAATLKRNRSEAGVTLAPTPGGREPRHAQILDRLAQLQGPEFDAVYVAAHRQFQVEITDQFGAYSQTGDNGGLRRFAQDTLPRLRVELEHSRRLPLP